MTSLPDMRQVMNSTRLTCVPKENLHVYAIAIQVMRVKAVKLNHLHLPKLLRNDEGTSRKDTSVTVHQ